MEHSQMKTFENLFDTYYRDLVFFSKCLVSDSAAAEDIVIDVFVKLWERSNIKLHGIKDIRGYLFGMTKNECLQFLKRKKRQDQNSEQYIYLNSETDTIFDTEKEIAEKNRSSQISHEIEKLPSPHKTVLKLYYYQEVPLHEIASRLHVPLGTIKSHKHRAEFRLRKFIKTQHTPL